MEDRWKIIYYKSPARSSAPVYDFINHLDAKAKGKVINLLSLLEEFGLRLISEHVKKLTGTELWELRILGQDSIRILYVAVTGKNFLLLHGFFKKKQKTDPREIKVALERLREYRSYIS